MPDTERHADFVIETTMQSMVDALVATGRVLRLSDRQPALAAGATKKIMELARAGERETDRLTGVFNALRD